jgi:molecular chaperone GrpE
MLSEKIEENRGLKEENEELREKIVELQDERNDRAEEVTDLEEKVERLKQEMLSLKKRGKKREANAKQNALRDVVSAMTKVRDTLQRAIEQDEEVEIRGGVETTLTQFDKTLSEFGVDLFDPAPGDEVEPERHKVMQKTASEQPEGTVVETFSVGYENDDGVIKTAKVVVSDGAPDADEG